MIKLLVGHPPRTVAELIDATGVTRTAVTEQLNEMVAAGFVEQTTEKLPGRGRPRHLFSATKAALVLLFANNQQLVVPAIWKAINTIGGEKLTKQVLRSVGRSLAQHYAENHGSRAAEASRAIPDHSGRRRRNDRHGPQRRPPHGHEADLRFYQHV